MPRGEPDQNQSPMSGLLVGCAALLVLAIAGGAGAVFFLTARRAPPPVAVTAVPIAVAPVVSAPEPAPVSAPTPALGALPVLEEPAHPAAPSPSGPVIIANDSVVSEGMDRSVIQRVVRQHVHEVQTCYERALAHDPALHVTVTAHFTIAADGTVSSATADGSDDATLTSCIASRVQRWMFPAPPGGGTVRVNYPFVLSSE